jgi:hypothetical protein
VWLIAGYGRALGANTKDAYERYTEMAIDQLAEASTIEEVTQKIADGTTDMWFYKNYNNLKNEYKADFLGIAITTAVYFALSYVCFHMCFKSNTQNVKESKHEQTEEQNL